MSDTKQDIKSVDQKIFNTITNDNIKDINNNDNEKDCKIKKYTESEKYIISSIIGKLEYYLSKLEFEYRSYIKNYDHPENMKVNKTMIINTCNWSRKCKKFIDNDDYLFQNYLKDLPFICKTRVVKNCKNCYFSECLSFEYLVKNINRYRLGELIYSIKRFLYSSQ